MAPIAKMAQRSGADLSAGGGKRLLAHSLASLIDQALLSGLNFALGLLLIRMATKQTYGVYSQLFVVGIFVSTVIDALITSPLTTIAPGKSPDQRRALANSLLRFQWQVSLTLAVLFGIGSAIVAGAAGIDAHPVLLGLAFAIYLAANARREYDRSISFIEARPHSVLRTDMAYALAVAAGIGILLLAGYLTVPGILLVLGLANLAGMWGNHADDRMQPSPASPTITYRDAVAEVMQRGRWSLPGALVAWATNYSYLYLAAAMLGVAAAADLNASRLLLVPISLSVLAWSRVARPMASRLFAARDWKHLDRLALASVVGIETVTVFYVLALWLALPWLQTHVLGAKYHDLGPMVLAWGGYFAINAARWIGSSWLTSNDQYRLLLISGVSCLIVMLAASSILIPRYGAWGAIVALIIVEAFDLLLIWLVLLPLLRRKYL